MLRVVVAEAWPIGLDQDDLFHTHEELLGEALARQEQRIAYVDKDWALGEVKHG